MIGVAAAVIGAAAAIDAAAVIGAEAVIDDATAAIGCMPQP